MVYRKFAIMCLVLTGFASLSRAQTFLTLDGCTGGCGTSPFAVVTLTQVDAQTVQVTETLLQGDQFVSTGAGSALAFNITGDPAIAISSLTSGFSIGSVPAKASSFGLFDYSISCSGCGPGSSGPLGGPLSFEVKLAGGGNLSIADFSALSSNGYVFASDILGSNGNTGNVAASGAAVTPEPASMLLFGSGLATLGAILRRRKRTP